MRLSNSMKKRIAKWAENALYRMNVSSADCYAFNLYKDSDGRLDFEGGWDWLRWMVDKNAEWVYVFEDKSFRKVVLP